MGTLTPSDTDSATTLLWTMLIGRSRTCKLRIKEPQVSSHHALIQWDGTAWEIKDLGSRNGTFINGQRLKEGIPWPLEVGARISFGEGTKPWCMTSIAAPQPAATLPEGPWRFGTDSTLLLPDEEAPVASIVFDAEGLKWFVERNDTLTAVEDEQVYILSDQPWQLSLPPRSQGTMSTIAATPSTVPHFQFTVSQDEEHVSIVVHLADQSETMTSRAHHYTILTLARWVLKTKSHRLMEDIGWIALTDLERQLALHRLTINTHIHRFRKQLQKIAFLKDFEFLERRVTHGQIRLTIPPEHITIRSEVS